MKRYLCIYAGDYCGSADSLPALSTARRARATLNRAGGCLSHRDDGPAPNPVTYPLPPAASQKQTASGFYVD